MYSLDAITMISRNVHLGYTSTTRAIQAAFCSLGYQPLPCILHARADFHSVFKSLPSVADEATFGPTLGVTSKLDVEDVLVQYPLRYWGSCLGYSRTKS